MKLEELKIEHLKKVCELYKSYLGGENIKKYIANKNGVLEEIIDCLHTRGKTIKNVVGSKYSPHSQLRFYVDDKKRVKVFFHLRYFPNIDELKKYKKSLKQREKFEKKAKAYLRNE